MTDMLSVTVERYELLLPYLFLSFRRRILMRYVADLASPWR